MQGNQNFQGYFLSNQEKNLYVQEDDLVFGILQRYEY